MGNPIKIFTLRWSDSIEDIQRNINHAISHIGTILGTRGIGSLLNGFKLLKQNNYAIEIIIRHYEMVDS